MRTPVLVVHSTVAPTTPAELGRAAGCTVLDAPVSGGPMGAADGTLAIMVGGDEAAYAVAEPVLARMGSKVVHAGPLGAGTKMKLARNLIHFVAFTAVTEAQRLAEAAGLDLVELGEVVRHTDAITGGPGAIMYRDTTAPLAADDFWHGVFDHVRALGEKDLCFAIELADTLGVDVPLARLAHERPRKGTGTLMGKFDDLPEQRRRGLEKMEEVYGFEMSDGDGDFFRYTADHLFADIWSRPGLSDRDRRLLLIGMLTGTGAHDVLSIQVPAAYANGELDDEALREIVIFVCHYAGWPNGARLNSLVEETIAKAKRASSDHVRGAPAGGVRAAVRAAGAGPRGRRLRRARVRRLRLAPSYRGETPTDGRWSSRWPTRPSSRPGWWCGDPRRPGAFSGTVVAEWLNVSSGSDAAPDWTYLAEEIVRRGHAWVGISAQHVGVEGGDAAVGVEGLEPDRAQGHSRGTPRCSHPGDAYCYGDLRRGGRRALDEGRSPTSSSTCGWRWGSRSRRSR